MANIPAELKFTKDHEWAKVEGDVVRIGISAHAVEQLGDITLVDILKVGTTLTLHQRFGDIESVKATSELFSPISGEILEVNAALENAPELVNEDPYAKAWMIVVKPANKAELETLMSSSDYATYLGTLDH